MANNDGIVLEREMLGNARRLEFVAQTIDLRTVAIVIRFELERLKLEAKEKSEGNMKTLYVILHIARRHFVALSDGMGCDNFVPIGRNELYDDVGAQQTAFLLDAELASASTKPAVLGQYLMRIDLKPIKAIVRILASGSFDSISK